MAAIHYREAGEEVQEPASERVRKDVIAPIGELVGQRVLAGTTSGRTGFQHSAKLVQIASRHQPPISVKFGS